MKSDKYMYPKSPELSILRTLTHCSLDETRLEPQWLTLIQIWPNQEMINTTLSTAFEISNLRARYKPKHFLSPQNQRSFLLPIYLYYV